MPYVFVSLWSSCDGAVQLHTWFLVSNYLFIGLTLSLLVVLLLGDKNIRRDPTREDRRQRELARQEPGLSGDVFPLGLVGGAGMGYIIMSVAAARASFVGLDASKDWPLIDDVMTSDISTTIDVLGGIEFPVNVNCERNSLPPRLSALSIPRSPWRAPSIR